MITHWHTKRSNYYLWMVLMMCAALASCVTPKYPELIDSDISDDAAQYDYSIGTGDTLNIYVWGYPDLQDSVPVRPDGQITTKLVEDLVATGKTPTELAREIESAYAEFVNNPVVTVSVGEFSGSRNQRVKIVGASNEAMTLPYTDGMTLLDLLIEAGGMPEFASGNRAVLIRVEAGERKSYSLRINDLVRKGDISANVSMRPGDIVLIPESWL